MDSDDAPLDMDSLAEVIVKLNTSMSAIECAVNKLVKEDYLKQSYNLQTYKDIFRILYSNTSFIDNMIFFSQSKTIDFNCTEHAENIYNKLLNERYAYRDIDIKNHWDEVFKLITKEHNENS
jgi:hypothetical protein